MVTTSWDDGHRLDLRLAEELARFGVAGTFYVAPRSAELSPRDRLRPHDVRELSQRFEVGSHTLTHPVLTRLGRAEARREITDGRDAVEDLVGHPVGGFCYPYGAFRAEHVTMVRDAGFLTGRTIRRYRTSPSADPLRMATTVHAASYRRDLWPVLRRSRGPARFQDLRANWDALARALFEEARAGGGHFHLWGHSWEIEANGDWDRLRSLLAFLAGQDDVEFVANGALAPAMTEGV